MSRKFQRLVMGSVVATATLMISGAAMAQEASASTEQGVGLPGATTTSAGAGNSDHDQMIGRLAVGYLGLESMSIAAATPGAAGPATVNAPVVGVRYWLDQMLGLDLGLGFSSTSSSSELDPPGTEVNGPSTTAFIIHAGVPLSLASDQHWSFQIVPELNVGFASGTVEDGVGPGEDLDRSGFHLDVGARAGAEIHFGFIDLPQLSLQAGIGLRYVTETTEASGGSPETTFKTSSTAIGTTVGDNPWNIFTSNVAALYYF